MSAQQGKMLFVNSVTAYWLVTTVQYMGKFSNHYTVHYISYVHIKENVVMLVLMNLPSTTFLFFLTYPEKGNLTARKTIRPNLELLVPDAVGTLPARFCRFVFKFPASNTETPTVNLLWLGCAVADAKLIAHLLYS